MNQSFFFTRRWFGFFLLFFLIWYPMTFIIVTTYQVTGNPTLSIASNVFTPLWALLISYVYFRKAQNNWSARFATSLGWMFLMFVLAGFLVKPVYGYAWTSIINWNVINDNWIIVVAILVGAITASQPKQKTT
jgi:hypothetical protein